MSLCRKIVCNSQLYRVLNISRSRHKCHRQRDILCTFSNDSGESSAHSTGKSAPRPPRRFLKKLSKLNESGKQYELTHCPTEQGFTTDVDPAPRESNQVEKLFKEAYLPESHEDAMSEFPSDFEESGRRKQRQDSLAYRPNIDPSKTSIVLFPGQGSQFVGMGEKLLPYPGVREMYEKASTILGYDLLDLCLNGPKTKLNKTVYCQPAVMVTSIAALIKMKELYPQSENRCVGVAGFSVGELAALVYAEVLKFEDAVELVQVRAEAMQQASEEAPSGMMTVFTGPESKLRFGVHAASEYCRLKLGMHKPVCKIANYLYTECKVVAGHNEALDFLEQNSKDFGIRHMKKLPVSGAFHTELMQSAKIIFQKKLREVTLQKPTKPVHSNVTAARYRHHDNVLNLLPRQIVKPVKWEQIMHTVFSREQGMAFPHTYELGPGRQLGVLLKKTNAKACETMHHVDV